MEVQIVILQEQGADVHASVSFVLPAPMPVLDANTSGCTQQTKSSHACNTHKNVLGELDDIVRRHNGGAERAEGGERADGIDRLSLVLEQRNEASNGGQKDVVT